MGERISDKFLPASNNIKESTCTLCIHKDVCFCYKQVRDALEYGSNLRMIKDASKVDYDISIVIASNCTHFEI